MEMKRQLEWIYLWKVNNQTYFHNVANQYLNIFCKQAGYDSYLAYVMRKYITVSVHTILFYPVLFKWRTSNPIVLL